MALVASIFVLGVTVATVPPITSALPAEILGPTMVSVGFGINGICSNLNSALAQPLVGFLLDVTKSYTFCLSGMTALSAIGALVAYTLKTN
jgi:MFS family permease